jgi:hypothetical protein
MTPQERPEAFVSATSFYFSAQQMTHDFELKETWPNTSPYGLEKRDSAVFST